MLKNKLLLLCIVTLLCSPMASVGAYNAGEIQTNDNDSTTTHFYAPFKSMNSNPLLTIQSPAAGYLYLFKLQPIQMPLASMLGLNYAVVIGRSINLKTNDSDIDHVKFVAKRMATGWETIRWDYRRMDGLGADLRLNSGLYTITVTGFNETNYELASDSINVLYIKIGREDFGVWVNTEYDNGASPFGPTLASSMAASRFIVLCG